MHYSYMRRSGKKGVNFNKKNTPKSDPFFIWGENREFGMKKGCYLYSFFITFLCLGVIANKKESSQLFI